MSSTEKEEPGGSSFGEGFSLEQDGEDLGEGQPAEEGKQIVGFFGRLGITLVIELALAWGWKYRKGSQLLFIGVANLVTQCLLNASLLYWGARETSRGAIIFWYILLELAVTGIEAAASAAFAIWKEFQPSGRVRVTVSR